MKLVSYVAATVRPSQRRTSDTQFVVEEGARVVGGRGECNTRMLKIPIIEACGASVVALDKCTFSFPADSCKLEPHSYSKS